MTSEKISKCLSARLEKWMFDNDVTQTEFAEMIGTSKTQINRWVNHRQLPHIALFIRILDVTGISADELLGRKEPRDE